MTTLNRRLSRRRQAAAAPDVGLQAERTAMAWQRTALGVGGLSALLLHLAERSPAAMTPGVAGLLVAVVLLVLAERRYDWTVNRVEADEPPLDRGMVPLVTVSVVALSAWSVLLLSTVGP